MAGHGYSTKTWALGIDDDASAGVVQGSILRNEKTFDATHYEVIAI